MTDILMRVDGSCYPNPGSMGIGVVIYKDNVLIKKISKFVGQGTNNIAEYEALICGLGEIISIKAERVAVYCDSQLVVKQLNGQFKVKDKKILPLFSKVKKLCHKIEGKIFFFWNGRENNSLADGLAKKAVLNEEIRKRKIEAKGLFVNKENYYYSVKNLDKKTNYQVELDLSKCNCLDFKNRAKKLKIDCRHIIAVREYLEKQKNNEISKMANHKMKILILNKMVKSQVWEKTFNALNKRKKLNLEITHFEETNGKNIHKYISEVEVVVGNIKNEEDIQRAKSLKLIQLPYAGVDKVNFKILKNRPDIYLCNIHSNKYAVAEHALSLVFALAKNTVRNDHDLRNGIWHGFSTREPNIQLHGKNLGIIGLGSIGWEIAKRGHALGMKIFAIKREINTKDSEKKKILAFLGVKDDLNKLLKNSDFIVLSVPLTKETNGMISKEELNLMKGKFLVNISRGNIIHEDALYESLKNNILAGAAIDAWYQYPSKEKKKILPSKYNFHRLQNIILSPHIAGCTDSALEDVIQEVFNNIVKVYQGEVPENQVNTELEY